MSLSGVTVLTGGGFHGKSTVLESVQAGIYNQVPGDGREYVVTDSTAFKARAENGRCVTSLDVTPFITDLPGDPDSRSFNTTNASGSTSMAANIQEALEVGCKLLLIDEDTAATNLLSRDHLMHSIIKKEPIKPLVGNIRALRFQHGVSTIIVVGSCGDYFEVANVVIGMEDYKPQDLTDEANKLIEAHPRQIPNLPVYGQIPRRRLALDKAMTGTQGTPILNLLFYTPTPPAHAWQWQWL